TLALTALYSAPRNASQAPAGSACWSRRRSAATSGGSASAILPRSMELDDEAPDVLAIEQSALVQRVAQVGDSTQFVKGHFGECLPDGLRHVLQVDFRLLRRRDRILTELLPR